MAETQSKYKSKRLSKISKSLPVETKSKSVGKNKLKKQKTVVNTVKIYYNLIDE